MNHLNIKPKSRFEKTKKHQKGMKKKFCLYFIIDSQRQYYMPLNRPKSNLNKLQLPIKAEENKPGHKLS